MSDYRHLFFAAVGTMLIVLPGCGGANETSFDDVTVSDSEIEQYYITQYDLSKLYGSGVCPGDEARQKSAGIAVVTYGDLAKQLAKSSRSIHAVPATSEQEYIDAFNWQDRLDTVLPSTDICAPLDLEKYKEVGFPDRDYIANRIKSRKIIAAKRQRLVDIMDNIDPPETDGAYLVSVDFALTPVPFEGKVDRSILSVSTSELPTRIADLIGDTDTHELSGCVRTEPSNVVSVQKSDLLGVYLRQMDSVAWLAVDDESITSRASNAEYGYDDYCLTRRGFGMRGERDGDQLLDMSSAQAGDVLVLKQPRPGMEDTRVAIFTLE